MNNSLYVQNSLKTIIEMLIDRNILDKNYKYDYDGFLELIEYNSKIYFLVTIEKDIGIIYLFNDKFKVSDFKKIMGEVENVYYNLLFLVSKEKITDNNKSNILEYLNGICREFQIFNLKQLQFNITKHKLQPKFEVLSDTNDVNEIYEKYGLIVDGKLKQAFPFILKTDPIAKYYGLKTGNLIKITKNSETSGEYVSYRVCV